MVAVYDIETLKGAFTYTDIDVETNDIHQFVIHEHKNELQQLVDHLMFTVKGHIGFNNLSFDYPILHYILHSYNTWWSEGLKNKEIILKIYSKAQEIIQSQNRSMFNNFVTIKYQDQVVPQLDLFKIWHYNNPAKSTSLKALEISMNYPNVVEMAIHHGQEEVSLEELETILNYNLNDVLATLAFYTKSKEKIELRKLLYKQYKLPCLNWNNGKIGEQLILKLYCEKTGRNPWEVSKLRTPRSHIKLIDCIPNNIFFKEEGFRNLLKYFESKIITETKGSMNYMIYHNNIKYVYGTGGIHGAIRPGVYESNDEFIIKSCDVTSLYPNLAIVYGFYPEHLGKEFLDVYNDDIIQVRTKEKAKGKDANKVIVDGFKEAANIPYGKSNDEHSFLYDPKYTLKTTIAGQLVLSMLIESLSEIPGSQVLMANTDGLEIRIPRSKERTYERKCKEWQELTRLNLEFADYQKMWIGDVNNYGCITISGKIKNKGRFEVDKVLGSEPAYHKDNSFRIVPYAIEQLYSKGIPVAKTIMNHNNIYDFCGRQKFKGEDYGLLRYRQGDAWVTETMQKNVRYYISNNGSVFFKKYKKGTEEVINKGFKVSIFNNYNEKDWDKYDIDYKFYIRECYKQINELSPIQTELLM